MSRRVGCGGWAGHLPPKNHFCPQNDKFECILPQFLTGRKHENLGTRILQFNREIAKLTKTVQKLSKNSRSDQGGSHHRPTPEYATAGNGQSCVCVCVCVCARARKITHERVDGCRLSTKLGARGNSLEVIKLWSWSDSGYGSRITFPLSLTLRDRALYDICGVRFVFPSRIQFHWIVGYRIRLVAHLFQTNKKKKTSTKPVDADG